MISLGSPLALIVALLAVVPVAGAALYAAQRTRDADVTVGGPPSLRRGRSGGLRRLRTALTLAAIVLIALAIARPRWGTSDVPVTRRGIDVAIALDISRSMTATDAPPTRAEAAAEGLRALLDHLRGDRVGLVTFAGDAFVRSPLSLDLEAIAQLVSRAQQEVALVRPGTNLAGALDTALGLLDVEDRARTQAIVLVSDGENLGSRLDPAIEAAIEEGVRVYTVAAGTEQGAEIAADAAGNMELSRANRATLERIARATGGATRELRSIAGLAVDFARLRQTEFAAAQQPAPVERFQWFLAAALIALAAQALLAEGGRPAPLRARRVALAAGALLALSVLACGSQSYRHVRDGNEAYEEGRYEEALSAYRLAAEAAPEDPVIAYNTGNALHRLRRYEEAAVASQQAVDGALDPALLSRATYALGSHAFRRDALEEARDAFIEVLLRDPEDDDARHNLELVLRSLAPPEPPPQQQPPDAEPGGGTGGDQQGGGGQPPPDATAAPADSADADGGGDAGQQPGAGQAGAAPPDGGQPAGPAGGELNREQALLAAQLALEELLDGLGDTVTLEQAQAILDLVRRVNSLEELPGGAAGGVLPPR